MFIYFQDLTKDEHDKLIDLSIPMSYHKDNYIISSLHFHEITNNDYELYYDLLDKVIGEFTPLSKEESHFVHTAIASKVVDLATQFGTTNLPNHIQTCLDSLCSAKRKLQEQ